MTESERAFKKIKESGASASTVFMYANGSSMWAPEVLDAALEGVLEKQAKAADVAASVVDALGAVPCDASYVRIALGSFALAALARGAWGPS